VVLEQLNEVMQLQEGVEDKPLTDISTDVCERRKSLVIAASRFSPFERKEVRQHD